MNLAFPALCIVLLVLPGIIFRKAYARGAIVFFKSDRTASNKYPVSKLPLTEEIAVSLTISIVLNAIWIYLAYVLCFLWNLTPLNRFWHPFFSPNYQYLLYLIYGEIQIKAHLYKQVLDYITSQGICLIIYFLSLYIFSGLAGRFCLFFIRRARLDHKFMFFRLEDYWFYFLFGEIFKFNEVRKFFDTPPQIDGTYVSVVVAHGEADVLYKGFLWDFYLDRQGNLDRLLLHNVIRCRFDPKDGVKTDGPSTPGTPASQILRLLISIADRFAGRLSIQDSTGGKPKSPGASLETNRQGRIRIVDRIWEFERVSSQIFTIKYADCKTLACTYFSITDVTPPRNGQPQATGA